MMRDMDDIYLHDIFEDGPTSFSDEDIEYAVKHHDRNRPRKKRSAKQAAVEFRDRRILEGYIRAQKIDRFTGCGQVPIGNEIPVSPAETAMVDMPRAMEMKANTLELLKKLTEAYGLRDEIVNNYMDGIVSIMYIDSEEKGHILTLDDDEEFRKAAEEMVSKYHLLPIAGFKFDGQDAPIFLADNVHYQEDAGGMLAIDTFGCMFTVAYRCFGFLGYIWYTNPETGKKELYFDPEILADEHDGIMYPIAAFPRLAAKDGHMPWDTASQNKLI